MQPCADKIGYCIHYEGGSIYWTHSSGAHEVHGAIRDKWKALGSESSFLGYPTTDETTTPDGIGRFNHFEHGSVYWTPSTGAHEVHGDINKKWDSTGFERGFLGYPTTDEATTPDEIGRFNHFEHGSVYWTPSTGAHEVHGDINKKWDSTGFEQGFLGYPITDEVDTPDGGVRVSQFQHGRITWSKKTGATTIISTSVFNVDSLEILNQKADSDHSDNDYLTLVWSVANVVTKNVQTFKKTLRVGGVLHTGDIVSGPFMTEPFNLGDDDVLSVNLVLVNLGSSDAEDQFRDAVQVTEKIAGVAGPVVGGIIGTIVAGDPLAGVKIGDTVAKAIKDVVSTFSDIFDFFHIHIGPPNCNGEVFHETLTYSADEVRQGVNKPASRSYAGPQAVSRCGMAPHTKVTFSARWPAD